MSGNEQKAGRLTDPQRPDQQMGQRQLKQQGFSATGQSTVIPGASARPGLGKAEFEE